MEIAHARAMEVKTKRRKLDSGEAHKSSSSNYETTANQCSCLIDSPDNSTSSAATSVTPDQTLANLRSSNELSDDSGSSRSSDLKVENFETDNSTFINSREATPSESSNAMESSSNKTTTKNKPSSAKRPSTAEIEEFFSAVEKHEAKRFAEKYNYDIVKDVPLEGRYEWVRIKQ